MLSEALASSKGADLRVVRRAGQTVQFSFYTVQKGGTRLFEAIFVANRLFLSTPDTIRPGQRPNIPALGTS